MRNKAISLSFVAIAVAFASAGTATASAATENVDFTVDVPVSGCHPTPGGVWCEGRVVVVCYEIGVGNPSGGNARFC